MKRIEKDIIGTLELPSRACYGIHTARAVENFPISMPFPEEWYRAVGTVKQACYEAYSMYKKAATAKLGPGAVQTEWIADDIIRALSEAASEVASGASFGDFRVPGISGGAGTSINMNVNEIIANLALIKTGRKPGTYNIIDPVEHANVFQSTNDVIPTALRIAVMKMLSILEQVINRLREEVERLEGMHHGNIRTGYTQMQQAVPSSYGKLFSAYSDALSRDWWRVSKCFERIKTVNLGGSAIGTGIAVPRFFIMEVTGVLQRLTGLPVTRSDNMTDNTSNLDSFVEVHAILKSHAVNLEKISADLRLLSSEIGPGELTIPARQAGSSIMPGKINPVIPEFVISSAHRVYANDMMISSLSAQGCLELNAYLPAIGTAMIESLRLLIASGDTLRKNLLEGLVVNAETGARNLMLSPSITTALVPYIGYHKASDLALEMKASGCDIFAANRKLNLVPETQLHMILEPGNLLKLGYSLSDLTGDSSPE